MAKGIEAGSTFLAGVLAKLSPEDRAKGDEALATLKALGGGTVVAAVGDGVLGQSELSRLLDEQKTAMDEITARQQELDTREGGLNQWHSDLETWHRKNKEKLLATTNGNGNGNGNTPPQTPPAGLTEEQLNARIEQERGFFLGYQRDQNEIMRGHFDKFKEVVPIEPLLRHPQIATLGLTGVYELVHKDRLAKYETDAAAKREADIRADERRKTLESQAQMPYPTPTGPGSGSPLDALEVKNQPVVDAAVAHYNRLTAERAAGSTSS